MKIKIRCLNCGRIEVVEYSIAMYGEWICYCQSRQWELIGRYDGEDKKT